MQSILQYQDYEIGKKRQISERIKMVVVKGN